MKNDRWTAALVRRLVKNADPEGMMDIVDLFLPTIINSLSKPQLKAFIHLLFERHLADLLQDLSTEERVKLLEDLMPILAQEFPLHQVDLTTGVNLSRVHHRVHHKEDHAHRG